jgi:putative endonuclease
MNFPIENIEIFYLYILYSPFHDRYYTGYTNDLQKRLEQHNGSEFFGYTSKFKPWIVKAVFTTPDRSSALKAEFFIKNQKTRAILEKLIQPEFVPYGELECLKRETAQGC